MRRVVTPPIYARCPATGDAFSQLVVAAHMTKRSSTPLAVPWSVNQTNLDSSF